MEDPIVESVIKSFRERSEGGIRKYGTTLADNRLTPTEWTQHLIEELQDAVLYATKLKQDLNTFTESDMIGFGRWIISNEEFGNTSSWSLETANYYLGEFLESRKSDKNPTNGNIHH